MLVNGIWQYKLDLQIFDFLISKRSYEGNPSEQNYSGVKQHH